jgi:hypothetical protein
MALNDDGDNSERGASITTHARACTVHAFCEWESTTNQKSNLNRAMMPRVHHYTVYASLCARITTCVRVHLRPLPLPLPLPVPLPAPLALEAAAASAAASTLLRSFSARVGSTAVLLLALAAPLRATRARLGGGPVITVFLCVSQPWGLAP